MEKIRRGGFALSDIKTSSKATEVTWSVLCEGNSDVGRLQFGDRAQILADY